MGNSANRVIVIYGDSFHEFYRRQSAKVRLKIDWTIGLIRDLDRVPEKYLKHLEGQKTYMKSE